MGCNYIINLVVVLMSSFFTGHFLHGQDSISAKDNSKPTNVYNQVDNFLEYKTSPDFNTIGYNPRISYAPHENHSFVLELPFLYNTKSEKFGLNDIRLRYFGIAYRNYDKFFGAFGASMDVFFPTGRHEYGLGSGSWRMSPGITAGFILNQSKTISVFPVLSYVYTSKPTSDTVSEALKEADHGVSLELISSFIINRDLFILVSPIYDIKNLNDEREEEFIIEIEPVFDIFNDHFQAGLFYRGVFKSNVHTFSIYLSVFF